jgi:Flp pilus assembly pilin Flp
MLLHCYLLKKRRKLENIMRIKIRFLSLMFLLSLVLVNWPMEGIGATWTQIGRDIDGEATEDWSGCSVSLSGDGTVVAIGARGNDGSDSDAGHVRVYQNVLGTWTQIGKDIDGEAAEDWSGCSVSLSGDGTVVAIGAPRNGGSDFDAGHVRVYQNVSGTWTQIGSDIDGEATEDWSGCSVSLSGDGAVVAIGASRNDGSDFDVGHVRVYQNVSGTWTQVGRDIDGEAAWEWSGESVSLNGDGTVVAIGAPRNNGSGLGAGHVRVYQNVSGTWTQISRDIDGEAAGDFSGISVSLSSDGTVVAIGAPLNDGSDSDAGHVRVYQNVSGTWTQIGRDIDGEAAGGWSGWSVSLSGDGTVVAFEARRNDGSGSYARYVKVYQNVSGTWTQIGSDIDGEAPGDVLGYPVSLSDNGAIVAIGVPQNDSINFFAGHVRIFTSYNYKFPWGLFLVPRNKDFTIH